MNGLVTRLLPLILIALMATPAAAQEADQTQPRPRPKITRVTPIPPNPYRADAETVAPQPAPAVTVQPTAPPPAAKRDEPWARTIGYLILAAWAWAILRSTSAGCRAIWTRARAWSRQHRPNPRIRFSTEVPTPAAARAAHSNDVRDALTGRPLHASPDLIECSRCHARYQRESYHCLAVENNGRCAACGGVSFGPSTAMGPSWR
jgi:hypothetical protein